ncbi:UNKNOWN [Stylonychia lemnae]|uniref:Transmembrane protein n=1 Tax=Stylonychia lemnae TaxID=5949 RepID=A0A078AT27_STYLE|nr:UNKNOWN [Stylonychia lemnae]|eukprot:CDW85610.1 UNKNOWN [Stylonychia lemnae]
MFSLKNINRRKQFISYQSFSLTFKEKSRYVKIQQINVNEKIMAIGIAYSFLPIFYLLGSEVLYIIQRQNICIQNNWQNSPRNIQGELSWKKSETFHLQILQRSLLGKDKQKDINASEIQNIAVLPPPRQDQRTEERQQTRIHNQQKQKQQSQLHLCITASFIE